MDYTETLGWLYGLTPRGIRLELDRMRAACALAGDPEAGLPVVHVAGTNGKGSTSATIERIARAAGLRTGLYTSPHLHSFAERIRVDGVPIGRDEIVRRAASLRAMLGASGAPQLTFFEVTTLLAFEAFRDRALDLVVLEVGLGGRLDATNVIARPRLSVITHVALDHQAYLGDTLEEVAREKAGIIRGGVPVLHAADAPGEERSCSARAIVDARARELGAPSLALGRELLLSREGDPRGGGPLSVSLGARRIEGLVPRLEGEHQDRNAALAVGAILALGEVEGGARYAIEDDAIRRGVREVEWPGRLELIERDGVRYLLDAAHNPDGARALTDALARRDVEGPIVLVFGAMADKAWRDELAILRPRVEALIAVAPPLARAERAARIAEEGGGTAAASVVAGLTEARARAGSAGLVVVCGSIFVLAEARAWLLGLEQEPLISM